MEESRQKLLKHIWHKDIDDLFAQNVLKRGDDLAHLKQVLEDGTLKEHERFQSVADIRKMVMEGGPTLREALTLSRSEMQIRNIDMTNVPHTAMERSELQMKQAMEYLDECSSVISDDEDEEEEEDEDEDEEEQREQETNSKNNTLEYPWKTDPRESDGTYTWFRTVWYRINMMYLIYKLQHNGRDKFLEYKIKKWYMAHLDAVTYLDSFEDPRDDLINVPHLKSLYRGMGKSYYDDDKKLFSVSTRRVQIRKTPLEIIQPAFPNLVWTVEEVIDTVDPSHLTPTIENFWTPVPHATKETHAIYLACVYILNQCKECMYATDDVQVEDALWAYYAGFTDIFMYGLQNDQDMNDVFLLTPVGTTSVRGGKLFISDNLSPWEMYGANADIQAFCAGDLPDLFHVLVTIPLWGEQATPPFKIGKIYQKSLPFACQRRHLIRLIVQTIQESESFWRIFSNLFWVMLASLYPGDLGPRQFVPTMRELLRSRELTSNKDLLIEALIADQPGFNRPVPNTKSSGANGGPLVVFVVFRLHMLYMAERNPTYVAHAQNCIDWAYFRQNTIDLANLIRSNGIFAQDPFAQARKKLSKTVKSPNSKVHRYRGRSEAVTLMERMNKVLQEHIFAEQMRERKQYESLKRIRLEPDETVRLRQMREVLANDQINLENMAGMLRDELYITQKVVSFYDELLSLENKSTILNLVMRIPSHQRLTVLGFSLLTLPQYGGISTKSVGHMVQLTNVYYETPLPQKFNQCIDLIDVRDFAVCTYYFNMVAVLSKISFVPLDAETVRRTDEAMLLRRNYILPGQTMPSDVYNVSIALCCEKICSLMGRGKYGAKQVSYDLERMTYICAHGKPLKDNGGDADSDNEDDDDKEKEDEDEEDNAGVSRILSAQNDRIELPTDILNGAVRFNNIKSKKKTNEDIVTDSTSSKGRGKRKSEEMSARKAVRNKRKQFHRIPCRQPILTINLRGRALIWGNIKETQSRYMFCPECGSLHMYTILNFSGSQNGLYRCNECATKEIMHLKYRECAYCHKPATNQVTEQYKLPLMDPLPREAGDEQQFTMFDTSCQWYYFCHTHYNVAKKLYRKVTKPVLWNSLKLADERRLKNEARKQGGRF